MLRGKLMGAQYRQQEILDAANRDMARDANTANAQGIGLQNAEDLAAAGGTRNDNEGE